MHRLLLALLFVPLSAVAQFSTATYTVTFESTWSASTHPDDVPPNPHFSGLIGAAHDASADLWSEGELASAGMESMAETGSKSLLEAEVNGLIASGGAYAVLSGGGIGVSPGNVELTFELNTDFPVVSLVSMVAPSPDWFVGVDGLLLYDGANWTPLETITLYAFDAGTDSGTMYTSPDADTQPPEPIALIDGYPFFYDGNVVEVGTFEFALDNVVAAEELPTAGSGISVSSPFPNPATSASTVRIDVGSAQQVSLELFNLLGQRVRTLYEGVLAEGTHSFRIESERLPRTIYVVRATGETDRVTRRLVVR